MFSDVLLCYEQNGGVTTQLYQHCVLERNKVHWFPRRAVEMYTEFVFFHVELDQDFIFH